MAMAAKASTANLAGLKDNLLLAFSTTQMLRDGRTPAHKGYRVHLHWPKQSGAAAGKIAK